MDTRSKFIRGIHPFVVATALSGIQIHLAVHAEDMICISISEKIDTTFTRYWGIYIHFRKETSIGIQPAVGNSIRWETSIEESVAIVTNLVTEYLNR